MKYTLSGTQLKREILKQFRSATFKNQFQRG